MSHLRFIDGLRDITRDVDIILCDIWGVVHNGLIAFQDACQALQTFRARGGTVILITNAPRLNGSVQRMLDSLNVPRDVHDGIVSSGDLTRTFIVARERDPVFQLGPARDDSVYRNLDITFAPLDQARYIVCTGLFDDETETAEDYRGMMEQALARKLTLICANPDMVVERGDRLIHCAGAIAELYRDIGGEVIFCGKPHRPIYDLALRVAAELIAREPKRRSGGKVLAIGDSVRTDLAGANAMGFDCLLLTRGIHAADFAAADSSDAAAMAALFGAVAPPSAVMDALKW